MGETAADTRREITQRRNELDATVKAVKHRTTMLRASVQHRALMAAPVVLASALAGTGVVLARRRRGGKVAAAARRLPDPARDGAIAAALRAERWANRRRQHAMRQRDELVEAVAQRIAEHQTKAERLANPVWRRASIKALETLASVGTAALVRRAMSLDVPTRGRATDRGTDVPTPASDAEVGVVGSPARSQAPKGETNSVGH